jgi:acyl carrier protein
VSTRFAFEGASTSGLDASTSKTVGDNVPDPMADDRARELVEFVRTNLLGAADAPVTSQTTLNGGLLDSMGLVLLAAYVEERFGVRVDDADLRTGELATIADILALVDRRR